MTPIKKPFNKYLIGLIKKVSKLKEEELAALYRYCSFQMAASCCSLNEIGMAAVMEPERFAARIIKQGEQSKTAWVCYIPISDPRPEYGYGETTGKDVRKDRSELAVENALKLGFELKYKFRSIHGRLEGQDFDYFVGCYVFNFYEEDAEDAPVQQEVQRVLEASA